MKICSTFHPSSSVISSTKCRLASRDVEHLVVAKLHRVDIYSLRPHGLHHECGLDIWGLVCSVKPISISVSGMRSNLVLMITHPEPELNFLSYVESETGAAELVVKKRLTLLDRSPRLSEFFNDVLVHPSGTLAVVHCYSGKLKVVVLKAGSYQQDFDVSIPESNIFSLAFLPNLDDGYTLAILHLDYQQRLQLCARDIDVDAFELSQQPSSLLNSTFISNKIIPYPTDSVPLLIPVQPETIDDGINMSEYSFQGGVLLVGGRQILLFELSSRESQEKVKGKRKRLEAKKKSTDAAEVSRAKAKELERESRKKKPNAVVEWPWSQITAWCSVDNVTSRFFLGDSFGRLALLSVGNVKEFGLILIPLGQTSSPTTLTYLSNQNLYLGSHTGDSQLLQISSSPVSTQEVPSIPIPPEIGTCSSGSLFTSSPRKGKEKVLLQDNDMDVDEPVGGNFSNGRVVEAMGSFITVLDSYKNIAPIMDAVLVDTDGTDEMQIVTCSGGANTGSVNVVRNGAVFEELAFVQGIADITDIWGVRSKYNDEYHSHLVVSTVNGTHLFQINDQGANTTFRRVESTPYNGLVTKKPTLAFSNFYKRQDGKYVDSSLVVQVVPNGAFLFEWDATMGNYMERATWKVENTALYDAKPLEIVAANVNGSQVALALSGGTRAVLCIQNNAIEFRELLRREPTEFSEISAISCVPLNPAKHASKSIIAAYWNSNIVEIFSISEIGLKSESKTPPLPAVVRSVLLFNFGNDVSSKGADHHAFLLAGLGDGSVASMLWKDNELKDLMVVSLGHAPVSLTPFQVDDKHTVLAAGNRATVFFYDSKKNRLANSPIMLKEISAATRFVTSSFASSLILASPAGLFVGRVRQLDMMHIRSVPFGLDNPRRIAHETSLKVFGVICTRNEPTRVGDYEPSRSSFQLIDHNSFAHLGQFNCGSDEEITSVVSFSTTVEGHKKPFFCLGTVFFKAEEKEPTAGRLLIFTAYTSTTQSKSSSLELSMLTFADVKGCVYSLKVVEDKIIAAVNSSILVFKLDSSLDESSTMVFSLKRIVDWNHNYLVSSLGSFGTRIVAGDQISSVSLLQVTETSLISQAKDYGPLYPVSVEALDSDNVICANDCLNICTFTLGQILGRKALERNGFYYMGDLVSKFVRGRIRGSHSTAVDDLGEIKLLPEIVYFTSSGQIGVIIDVQDKELAMHLTALQRNLAAVVSSVGSVSHTRYRAPKNTRGPSDADGAAFGFIDGDFLEHYLTLSPDDLIKVMKGSSTPEQLKLSSEQTVKVLERLQSLH